MAEELKKAQPYAGPNTEEWETWCLSILAVIKAFKGDNAGFDTYRFARACGFTADDLTVYRQSL
jgi:hypothetical protein